MRQPGQCCGRRCYYLASVSPPYGFAVAELDEFADQLLKSAVSPSSLGRQGLVCVVGADCSECVVDPPHALAVNLSQ